MSPLQKSLLYDGVVLAASGWTATATEGTVRGVALFLAMVTLVKAPYDAWEAWRTPDADG